ncbi:hypothetical protein PRN20_10980 [Devosia sp. ZB163]|uniref:hypothetical protein n=1 Tax=Devosia sp. ZB163 TaxID=3025938 RepID=UPI00236076AE|nr:hypothetical protein [Devosia sp. ZB163]MDC9824261.1 hypothetical protein [Devosia sp. ZB163]
MVPVTAVEAPADLGARFSSVLSKLDGRSVSTDALFDTLKLETLDWGMDHGVKATDLDAEDTPVAAESAPDKA